MSLDNEKLSKIEGLLTQSLRGYHFLFDHKIAATILKQPTEDEKLFKGDNMKKVQDLFNELVEQESYIDKLSFIQGLDNESYEILLRTYFHLVENSAQATTHFQH